MVSTAENKRSEGGFDLSGCEMIGCDFYKDGKCTDPVEYVDRETGDQVCRRRPEAISKADLADINLREAARDMYDALKDLVEEYGYCMYSPYIDRARAAIAKAEGAK